MIPSKYAIGERDDEDGLLSVGRRSRLGVSYGERVPTSETNLPITLVGSGGVCGACCADRSSASNCVFTRPAATAAPAVVVSQARRDMRALSGCSSGRSGAGWRSIEVPPGEVMRDLMDKLGDLRSSGQSGLQGRCDMAKSGRG